MKIAILGDTGFVGHYLVSELLNQGDAPSLLIRNTSADQYRETEKISWLTGSLDEPNSLKALLAGNSRMLGD
jgi:uncharacterized protein YbjT (DUF2867 family)